MRGFHVQVQKDVWRDFFPACTAYYEGKFYFKATASTLQDRYAESRIQHLFKKKTGSLEAFSLRKMEKNCFCIIYPLLFDLWDPELQYNLTIGHREVQIFLFPGFRQSRGTENDSALYSLGIVYNLFLFFLLKEVFPVEEQSYWCWHKYMFIGELNSFNFFSD